MAADLTIRSEFRIRLAVKGRFVVKRGLIARFTSVVFERRRVVGQSAEAAATLILHHSAPLQHAPRDTASAAADLCIDEADKAESPRAPHPDQWNSNRSFGTWFRRR
jgi:hypothetical protein